MKKISAVTYLKNHKFSKLFLKNFFMILSPMCIIAFSIYFMLYVQYKHGLLDDAKISAQNNVAKIQNSVDFAYKSIKNIGIILSSDLSLQKSVSNENSMNHDYDWIQNNIGITKLMSSYTNEYINSIYACSNKNSYILTSDGISRLIYMKDTGWTELLEEKQVGMSVISRERISQNGQGVPCVSMCFNIPYDQISTPNGYLIINMEYEWFETLVKEGTQQFKDFYVVNGMNDIIFSFDKSMLNKNLECEENSYRIEQIDANEIYIDENEKMVVCSLKSENNDWNYVYVSDISHCFEELQQYSRNMLFVFALVFCLCMVVSYFISLQVFQPIKEIIRMIDNPTDFYELNSIQTENDGNKNELKYILTSFMKSITEQERYKEELTKYIIKYKETQITLLQSQLNPHFLYNTLQTMSFLSMELLNGENRISNMINSLSVMLRELMNINQNMIPISEEVRYTKAYIEILEKRYDGKLSVTWDCPKELMNFQTVKFILQPLIENSIRHGYKNMKTPGEIKIRIERMADNIRWTVSDFGTGAEPSWVEKMNHSLRINQVEGDHIALKNVNQRIKLLFGEDYGLKIIPCSMGFTIQILTPVVD